MLRNSSETFISQSTSRKFLDTIEDILMSSRTSPVVRERLIDIVGAAAYASGSSRYRGIFRRESLIYKEYFFQEVMICVVTRMVSVDYGSGLDPLTSRILSVFLYYLDPSFKPKYRGYHLTWTTQCLRRPRLFVPTNPPITCYLQFIKMKKLYLQILPTRWFSLFGISLDNIKL
jgi:hypothetical protein